MSSKLREVARETVGILESGHYAMPGGGEVRLAEDIARAVAGTRLYLPDDELPPGACATGTMRIEVTQETTLAAARRIGGDVACLVFASAKNPGGGFRSGAQAQEESLARTSALYACQLRAPEFYEFHRRQKDLRYSDRIIYSPGVPVFRDDDGELLERPYRVAFLTAAAPNLGAITASQAGAAGSVPAMLNARAARVLQVAAAHQHRRLVLGAWGCGVFRNDPAVVATAFARALRPTATFDQVVFAVHDRLPGAPVRRTFSDILAVESALCPAYREEMTRDGSDDVVEQGGDRFPLPQWRLSRGSAVLAAVTLMAGLVAGLAAGYSAGQRHAGNGAAAPQRPRTSASSASPLAVTSLALAQNTVGCSAQIGGDLQLGVQVTNRSPAALTLGAVKVVLPLGGLRAISQQWGPCGALPAGQTLPGSPLAPGDSTWFTVTFKVLLKCPGPLPVQFNIGYAVGGQHAVASLPGFPDLSQVPYGGCPGT